MIGKRCSAPKCPNDWVVIYDNGDKTYHVCYYHESLLRAGLPLSSCRHRRDRVSAIVNVMKNPNVYPCRGPKLCGDAACPEHGVAASNARQNEFYRRNR